MTDKSNKGLITLPVFYSVLCAGIAGSMAELSTIHIDTIKVRMMLQGEEAKQAKLNGKAYEMKYRSMIHCYSTIAKEEGVISLFKGLSAGIQRQVIFAGLRIGLYPNVRDFISKDSNKITMIEKITASLITGCFAITCASPTEVVKIRLQADGKKPPELQRYHGTYDAYRQIIKKEGFFGGLYRGLNINILRNASFNCAELVSYDTFKDYMTQYTNLKCDSKFLHITCGSLAGFTAVTLFSSFDVVKTRLLNDTNKYKGVIDCFKKSYHSQGWRVFYSGYIPNLSRVMLWNACCFLYMERCQLFAYRRLNTNL